MGFLGINQFGALTSKVGQVLTFEDFDKNGDGKITEDELDNLFKDAGMDTVEISTIDKNEDKEISEDEFEIWSQQAKMQEAVNGLYGQIAKDFSGSNSKYIPWVKADLKEYIEKYTTQYVTSGEKLNQMAERFSQTLPDKYEAIKNEYLNPDMDDNSEKFLDVFNEFTENVPDQTSTYEEKELALKYIKRMLACSDITPELKAYWNDKKVTIEQEQKYCLPADARNIDNKLKNLIASKDENGFKTAEDVRKYYKTYIEYIDSILDCKNLSVELKSEYQKMKTNALEDLILFSINLK